MKDSHLLEILDDIEEYERMNTHETVSGFGPGAENKRALPATESLAASDFNVCEDCGGPALLHPRLELGTSDQSWNGPRPILCCACLHAAAKPSKPRSRQRRCGHRLGDQIWQCGICETERAWGLLEPADEELVPALSCERCNTSTRHVYLGVA